MPIFDKQWRAMGLDDNDLQALQIELLKDPQIGSVIKGTGKLRKMRFAFPNRGKKRLQPCTVCGFCLSRNHLFDFCIS